MVVSPINLAGLTGITRLYDDYINGRMSGLLAGSFTDKNKITQVAGQIAKRAYPRNDLVALLRDNNRAWGATKATLNNIERLGDSQSLCVFAGQQTGIFIGPILTIYKALTAVKLALHYERLLKRPVIPCFWMATDDHDFSEISAAGFLERGGELTKLAYDSPDANSGLPVSDLKFDNNIISLLEKLDNILLDSEFKKPLLEFIRESYKPGESISGSFARLFNYLIGDYGIVLVDPNFAGLKAHFRKIFFHEIENHEQTYATFDSQTKQLAQSGYHTQIHKSADLLNIFYHDPRRLKLTKNGKLFKAGDSMYEFTAARLLEMADKSPANFSPNALLRPIVQASAFPTLCQITGPSELSYYAQIAPMFELFDTSLPIIFPRPGLTLAEPQVKRIIDKYQLDIVRLKTGIDQVIGEVINRLFPSDAAAGVDSIKDDLRHSLNDIANTLKQSDPDGYQLADKFQKKIDFEFSEFQKKLIAANKKRHDDLTVQIKRTRDFLFPDNQLQERLISPVYYANKFGSGIFDQIYKTLDIERANHMVMEI